MPITRSFFTLFLLSIGLSSCKSDPHVEPSFYYWKTRFELSAGDSVALAKLGTHRLYIRMFDVDNDEYSGEVVPIARLDNVQPFPRGIEVVPVIFIKNRIFGEPYSEAEHDDNDPIPDIDERRGLDSAGIRDIAEKIVRKTLRMAKRHTSEELREIQLDCDWTPSTREKFFYLVREIKRLVRPVTVSATIRLHQFKYADKTGVPPADRGMLMYYNMGKLRDTNTKNYILDNDEGAKYLQDAKTYPLPLDFALPIHTQGTAFYDNPYDSMSSYKFVSLVSGEVFEALRAERLNLDSLGNNKYRCIRDYQSDVNRLYLQKDFLIRYDQVSEEELTKAARLVAPLANSDKYYVTFFHLDPMYLEKHSYETLAHIVDQFR